MGRGGQHLGQRPALVKKAAAVLGANVGHYVYISSVSAYADLSKPGVDESSPVTTIDDPTTEKIDGRTFGALKALSEKAAETSMPGRVTVVRPGLIVGPEDPPTGSPTGLARSRGAAKCSPPAPPTTRSSSSTSATWGNSSSN